MATLVLPYPTFVNGTTADGSQVTLDLSAITALINGNIDTTNIGAAGIDVSKIVAAAGVIGAAGSLPLAAGVILKWGTATAVPWDGSAAAAVSFATLGLGAFPTAIYGVLLGLINNTGYGAVVSYDTPAQTGFNIDVGGAPIGTTGSVFWVALGK